VLRQFFSRFAREALFTPPESRSNDVASTPVAGTSNSQDHAGAADGRSECGGSGWRENSSENHRTFPRAGFYREPAYSPSCPGAGTAFENRGNGAAVLTPCYRFRQIRNGEFGSSAGRAKDITAREGPESASARVLREISHSARWVKNLSKRTGFAGDSCTAFLRFETAAVPAGHGRQIHASTTTCIDRG